MPRRHSNHVCRRAVHLDQSSRYLASTTSECTPFVSRKAHVDKSSFQVSRIFQWSPITLRSPAKKTRKTLDDVSSLRRAVGAGDASVTHPSKSGAWSQGVLTMRVFPEDGRAGTFPTATPPKRRTDVRGHMPVFSPIALRSLGDTPTVRHPPPGVPARNDRPHPHQGSRRRRSDPSFQLLAHSQLYRWQCKFSLK